MPSYFKLTIFLCGLVAMILSPDTILALIPETNDNSTEITNEANSTEILDEDLKLLPGNYTPDQINEIIYNLYQLIQNYKSTEIGHSHDIAVLIDIICSNELYENAVEACDIVTELPIESNNY
jgi:hypothetical protein